MYVLLADPMPLKDYLRRPFKESIEKVCHGRKGWVVDQQIAVMKENKTAIKYIYSLVETAQ